MVVCARITAIFASIAENDDERSLEKGIDALSDWIAFQIAGDEGLPLIFLHGLNGDAEQWRPQLDAFADRYRAIAWDMPGYGDSAPLEMMTFPALADALATLFDRLSIDQAHLIGHSIGGMIAQTFAQCYPDRLRSLTLVATSAAFGQRAHGKADDDWRKRFVEQQLGPLDRGATIAELAPKIVKAIIGDQSDPAGLEQAILSLAGLSERGYRAAVDCFTSFDQEAGLANIQVPTLLVAGERDPIVAPVVMQAMAKAIPGSHIEILPGCGHLINLEQSHAFSRILDTFLKRSAVH